MGWLRRSSSSDDSLCEVARSRGWREVAVAATGMLPPSHETADVHGLRERFAPACAGRAFELELAGSGWPARVSHLRVLRTNEVDEVYDVVGVTVPPAAAARFELGVGAWGNHRLSDRFGHVGAERVDAAGAALGLRIARDTDPLAAAALATSTRWTELDRLLGAIRGGWSAEVVGTRAAVFVSTSRTSRPVDEWISLVTAAEQLAGVLAEVAAARSRT